VSSERSFGFTTAVSVVVASMIGTGVFTTTGFLLLGLQSGPGVLAIWILGGLLAACGALAYAELVAALPENGGEYQLLSRIYHPAVGFVAGFVSLVVGFSAPIAATAFLFGAYLNSALGTDLPPWVSGVLLVLVTSFLHSVRVGAGSGFQNIATVSKVALIAAFIAGGLAFANPARITETPVSLGEALLSPAFAVGLVFVSYSYAGWNAACYIAGEVKNPQRTLPLALVAGTLVVTLLYVAVNAVFLSAAPASELAAAKENVATVAATALFGDVAGRALAAVIAIGLVSTVSALVMTGPRISEAMGKDYRVLALLAQRRAGGGPTYAIALQAALAFVMIATSSFDALVEYVGFTLSISAGLTVVGVVVLRLREPTLPRPYRTWLFPVPVIASVVLTLWMVAFTLYEKPVVSLVGLATIATGLVVYFIARSRQAAK
jgi:APA family basic amino acid/polyamine antiporter